MCYLGPAVVLLGEERHDGGCNDVTRPVGGAACCLEQFGTWPHQFQVWLTKVVFAVWSDTGISALGPPHRQIDTLICPFLPSYIHKVL